MCLLLRKLIQLPTVLLLLCFTVSVQPQDASTTTTTRRRLIPNGSQQLYEVVNDVIIKELQSANSQQPAGYIFRSQLKFNSVWHTEREQLLQVYLTDSTLSSQGVINKITQSLVQKIPDRPFYISLVDGKPDKVIAHTSRDQSLLNLERGIASLLQLQYVDRPVTEIDVSGQCSAFYSVKSSTRIEKIKTDCSNWDLRVNYRLEKALSVQQHSNERIYFDLTADGQLLTAESIETHKVALEANPNVGSVVQSTLRLNHLAAGENEIVEQLNYQNLDEAIKSLLEWYRVFDIEADVDGGISEIKDVTLKKEITNRAAQLADEKIGKEELAIAFAELLPLARITKQPEFVEILNAQKTLHSQLVDLLGAVQTIESHNAIHEVFKYDQVKDTDLLEKYLQALAVGTHPDRGIIEDLYKRLQAHETADGIVPIKNERLRDIVLQTVASLTKQSAFDPNDPLLEDIRTYILRQLDTDCKEDDIVCKTRAIRALQNLQDVTTLPILFKNALEGGTKISVAAAQALKSFPITVFNQTHRKTFAQIFFQRQRKYDSTARTFALDILLALRPTKEQLGEILDYLSSNDRHFEIKTYVIQKLKMLAEKCPRFNALLRDCLAERPNVNNYHIIGQKGLTTVLTRQLSQSPAFNESLLSVQEIYQGALKRGSVELLLQAGREETSTFKLGLFTSGLSSFMSDDSDTADENFIEDDKMEDDDSPSTAGMEISVQGILMRPLIFFDGQTELMGHVWRGTASEPTPAYQATTLAQDHEHYIILASGATIYIRFIGMKSIDLNGKVELSIWNRNANTEIQQNSASAVVGIMIAGWSNYAKLENKFTISSEPNIKLQADIDFYSQIKLCMQLQRPEMNTRHSNIKSVFLIAAPKPYQKIIKTNFIYKFPGRTLALNQKNNEMCNMIFDS